MYKKNSIVLLVGLIFITTLIGDLGFSDFEEEKELIEDGEYQKALKLLKEKEENYTYLRTKNVNNINQYIEYSLKLAEVLELIGDVYEKMDKLITASEYYNRAILIYKLLKYDTLPKTEGKLKKDLSEKINKESTQLNDKINKLNISDDDEREDTNDDEVGEITDTEEDDLDEVEVEVEEEETTEDTEETEEEETTEDTTEDTTEEAVKEIIHTNFKYLPTTDIITINLNELENINYKQFYNKYLYVEYNDDEGLVIDGAQGFLFELGQTDKHSDIIKWTIYKTTVENYNSSNRDEYKSIKLDNFIQLLDNTKAYKKDFIAGIYIVEIENLLTGKIRRRVFNLYNEESSEINETDEDTTEDTDEDTTEESADNLSEESTYSGEPVNIKASITMKSGAKITALVLSYSMDKEEYKVKYMGNTFTVERKVIENINFLMEVGDIVDIYLDNGNVYRGKIISLNDTTIRLELAPNKEKSINKSKIVYVEKLE